MSGLEPQSVSVSSAAAQGYAGDVDVQEAWRVLKEDADAVLIDVRTQAEWAYVGVPDLSDLGKDLLRIEWQVFPSMEVNPSFAEALKAYGQEQGWKKSATLMFVCRSGVRSRHAAQAMTGTGYSACYNVAGGFEGDLDEQGHRGSQNGWKAAGLPWVQS